MLSFLGTLLLCYPAVVVSRLVAASSPNTTFSLAQRKDYKGMASGLLIDMFVSAGLVVLGSPEAWQSEPPIVHIKSLQVCSTSGLTSFSRFCVWIVTGPPSLNTARAWVAFCRPPEREDQSYGSSVTPRQDGDSPALTSGNRGGGLPWPCLDSVEASRDQASPPRSRESTRTVCTCVWKQQQASMQPA